MRVILISPMNVLPYLVSIINPDVEIAKIVAVDLKFANGMIAINGRNCEVCSYDWLREAVTEYHYDYILLTGHFDDIILEDLKQANISSRKLFRLNTIFCAPEYLHAYVHFVQQIEPVVDKYKIFITGISHGQVGTDLSCYQLPILNCAHSTQDLYYDYQFAKKLLSLERASFKYALIELVPYKFHYDISIGSGQQWLMLSYYLAFHDVHNYQLSCEDIEAILTPSFLRTDHLQLPSDFNVAFHPPMRNWLTFTPDKRMQARRNAERWNTKRYPATVKENEQIFEDYISLCEAHGVFPIVVVFPLIDAYRAYFPKDMFDELKYIVRKHGAGKRFSFLDKSNFDSLMTYDDFFDPNHLNQSGAKKMSTFLNNYIMDLENTHPIGGGVISDHCMVVCSLQEVQQKNTPAARSARSIFFLPIRLCHSRRIMNDRSARRRRRDRRSTYSCHGFCQSTNPTNECVEVLRSPSDRRNDI